MRSALLLLALGSTGCSFGFGSAFVGQWNARDEVKYRACLEDDSGKCVDEKAPVQHVEARSYSGVIIPFPAMGAGFVTTDTGTRTSFRLEPGMEILRGHGRAALGVRPSFLVDTGRAVSVPVMLLGHYALGDRFSLYGGPGLVPYSRYQGNTSHLGGRGLLGFQFATSRARSENYTVFSGEVDAMWLNQPGSYRSIGFTLHWGIYF